MLKSKSANKATMMEVYLIRKISKLRTEDSQMKNFKRIGASILSAIIIGLTCTTTSFATTVESENANIMPEVFENFSTQDVTRASTPPTELYDLATNDPYIASIEDLAVGWGTLTKKYFRTSTKSIYMYYDLDNGNDGNSSRVLKIQLYEQTASSWSQIEEKQVSFSGTKTGRVQFSGLSTSKNYYIRFYNDTYRSNSSISKDINGSVEISQKYI